MTDQNHPGSAPPKESRESFSEIKSAREARGRTLEDLFKTTRIRVGYLQAIEEGNFAALPERIYAETFIRTYAKEVGVSADEILERYRQFFSVSAPKRQPAAQRSIAKFKLPSFDAPTLWISSRMAASILAVAVLVGFFIFIIATQMQEKPDIETLGAPAPVKEELKTPEPVAPVKPEEATAVPQAPGQAAPPAAAAPAATAPYRLTIEAIETTWVNITEDDNPPYQLLLRPGDRIDREASSRFLLDVGNAAGINVQFQGKILSNLGRSGEVVHLELPEARSRN